MLLRPKENNMIVRCGAWLGFAFSLVSSLFCGAQEHQDYKIDYIDVSDGLSNDYVSKVIEDNQGIKWFATEGGLNKYDGREFSLYRPGLRYPELKNENIETLFKDKAGNIWVGTKSGGLSRYDPVKDRFECFNGILINTGLQDKGLRILAINEDGAGNIWAATADEGIFVFSPLNRKLQHHFKENSVYTSSTKIILDRYDNIWIATSNKLFRFDAAKKKLIRLNIHVADLQQLIELPDKDELLLLTVNGLYSLNTDDYSVKQVLIHDTYFKKLSTASIAPDGRLWFGSWRSGLYRTDKDFKNIEKVDLRPSFYSADNKKYELILDILHDEHGLTWIATGYGGVVKLSPSKNFRTMANTVNKNIGLPENNIHAITVDKNNVLWCGTWSQGLAYSTKENRFKKHKSIGDFKVNTFLETQDHLLIGTRKGVFSLKNSDLSEKFRRNDIELSNVTSLLVDINNRLWAGSADDGIAVLPVTKIPAKAQDVTYFTKGTENGLNSNRISKIQKDWENRVWIGTFNGLYRYDDSSQQFERFDNRIENFPSVIILSLFVGSDKTLWAGVPGALLEIDLVKDNPVLKNSFTRENGLFNDYITAITDDSYGNIWVSTAGGISKLNKEKRLITNYGIDDGINSISFNINASFNNKDFIFFGSNNGLLKFNPDFVNEVILPPNIVFTSLKLNNEPVHVNQIFNGNQVLKNSISYTDHINLSHNDKIISFTMSPTDYLNQNEINYHYKLVGLHNEWVNNYNSPVISLSGLSSGNYDLMVKASRDNINFGNTLHLSIKVLSSPWNSWYAYLLYTLIVIGILLVIMVTLNKQTRLKSSLEIARIAREKEHDLTEAKLNFFTNISHEFKTPLTLIMSPLTQLLSDRNLNHSLRQKVTNIHSNANRLLHLINQLLDFRKAENGMLNLRAAKGDFAKFAYEIYLSFEGLANSRAISFGFSSDPKEIMLTYDRDKMEIVLCNLLTNAFKHTKNGGEVALELRETTSEVKIKIIDNGRGIPKEYHNKIFDKFYQIRQTDSLNVVGSGIGLSFSKKIVEQHHGAISVDSEPGKGAVFTITVPKGEAFFRKEELLDDFKGHDTLPGQERKLSSDEFNTEKVASQELLVSGNFEIEEDKNTTILIVDDNVEILSFLEDLLADNYRIITAENGSDALEIALREIPDIILSDVMMPGINGISLCSKVKSNITTSHIPVVLLTARTATVFEVDGLKTGADDYIKKPFDPAIVTARLESILKNREKLRKYYVNKIRFEPNNAIKAKDFEGEFLKKAIAFINENLENDHLGIDSLASHMCMSQSTLFRKIKSLTGMSSSTFIRSIRLKNAAERICSEEISIKQVAFEVGFKDYKHFKNCFKAQFNCLPSEYKAIKLKKLNFSLNNRSSSPKNTSGQHFFDN